MGSYISQSDLEDAISKQTVMRLFDDDGDGIADASAVARIIASAEALVNSRIKRSYPKLTLPIVQVPQSDLLKEASLMLAIPLSYRRRPEYPRNPGANAEEMKAAMDYLEGLCTGHQYLFDVVAEPGPITAAEVAYTGTIRGW